MAHVSRRLSILESVIQKSLEDAGKPLHIIHDDKLYMQRGFTSFQEYCEKYLRMSRQHAYRMMNAAKVKGRLGNVTHELSESQIRELSPLANFDVRAAAKVVRELRSQYPRLTAAVVRTAVQGWIAQHERRPEAKKRRKELLRTRDLGEEGHLGGWEETELVDAYGHIRAARQKLEDLGLTPHITDRLRAVEDDLKKWLIVRQAELVDKRRAEGEVITGADIIDIEQEARRRRAMRNAIRNQEADEDQEEEGQQE